MANEQPNNRQFDWGPPVQTGDNMKEGLVYVIIIAILGVGTWFLLDINKQKHSRGSVRPSDIEVDNKLDNVIPEKRYEKPHGNPSEITIKYAPKDDKSTGISSSQTGSVNTLTQSQQNQKGFFVQIGAFGDEASAREIYELLKKEDVVATLLKPDDQFEIYRLVVGPYPTEKQAEDKAEQLNAIDFPCFVVEAQ